MMTPPSGAQAATVDTATDAHVRGLQAEPSVVSAAGIALTVGAVLAFLGAGYFSFEQSMMAIALATAGALVAFVVSPGIGLLGIGLLCTFDVPIRVYVFTNASLRYNTINYVLLAVGVPLSLYLWRLGNRQTRWLVAFIALLAIGVTWSPDRFLGAQTLLDLLPAVTLIACFARAVRMPDVLRWMAQLNATAAAACLLAYFAIGPGENTTNVNALAQVPIAALASLALAASQPGVIRNWQVVGLLATANLGLVFLTASRGGLAVGGILAVYVVFSSPHAWWRSYMIALCAMVLVLASTRFVAEYNATVVKWSWLVNEEMTLSQATSTRSDLIRYGWSVFRAQPLGVGTGGFIDATDDMGRRGGRPAHSAWVKTLAENGVPGIVLLAGFLLSFRRPKHEDPARLGLLVICVAGAAFLFVEFQSKSVWLLVAGAAALLHTGNTRPAHRAFVPVPEPPLRAGMRASVLPRPVEPVPDEPPAGEWDEMEELEIEAPPPAAGADAHREEDDEK